MTCSSSSVGVSNHRITSRTSFITSRKQRHARLTKKPMKPMTTKPRAVRIVILLNSAPRGGNEISDQCCRTTAKQHSALSARTRGPMRTSPVWLCAPFHQAHAVLAKLLEGSHDCVHGCGGVSEPGWALGNFCVGCAAQAVSLRDVGVRRLQKADARLPRLQHTYSH